jgi:hypothetical protein
MVDPFSANVRSKTVVRVASILLRPTSDTTAFALRARRLDRFHFLGARYRRWARLPLGDKLAALVRVASRKMRRHIRGATLSKDTAQQHASQPPGLGPVGQVVQQAQRAYIPKRHRVNATLIWASRSRPGRETGVGGGWENIGPDFERRLVEGDHDDLVTSRLPELAQELRTILAKPAQ